MKAGRVDKGININYLLGLKLGFNPDDLEDFKEIAENDEEITDASIVERYLKIARERYNQTWISIEQATSEQNPIVDDTRRRIADDTLQSYYSEFTGGRRRTRSRRTRRRTRSRRRTRTRRSKRSKRSTKRSKRSRRSRSTKRRR